MKLTEKGQVTIPLEIREKLGIRWGSEVEFAVEGDHAILRKIADPAIVAERLEKYRGAANSGMSTEEILELTRA
jgi:AbrB family looped-hinge helix DNA binding protein